MELQVNNDNYRIKFWSIMLEHIPSASSTYATVAMRLQQAKSGQDVREDNNDGDSIAPRQCKIDIDLIKSLYSIEPDNLHGYMNSVIVQLRTQSKQFIPDSLLVINGKKYHYKSKKDYKKSQKTINKIDKSLLHQSIPLTLKNTRPDVTDKIIDFMHHGRDDKNNNVVNIIELGDLTGVISIISLIIYASCNIPLFNSIFIVNLFVCFACVGFLSIEYIIQSFSDVR